mgnify:CR=1 FL=1
MIVSMKPPYNITPLILKLVSSISEKIGEVNANYLDLKQLVTQTQGKIYAADQTKQLIDELLKNENYKQIQKSVVKHTPLIDWKYLLISLVVLLSAEWFIRKYNGLL